MSVLILESISTEAPCGIDCKYEDAFLSVEAEIDKATSVVEGAMTDWKIVCEQSETLLAQQSKDVKLACWWVFGQYRLYNLEGLERALGTLNALLQAFEQALFPTSKKVKLNTLVWLESMLTAELIKENQITIPAQKAENFLSLFSQLQEHAKKVCETQEQLFKKLCQLLEVMLQQEKKRHEANSTPKTAEISQSATASTPREITNDADAAKTLSQMKKSAEMLSTYWRQKQMGDLRAMRLGRMIGWLETEGLPITQNTKTALNPPSLERIESIETLMGEANYTEAFELVETMVLRSPFWLDGHFKAFKILEAAQKHETANELKNHLVSFVKSHEGILELSFRDGTPFAPLELKTWLDEAISSAANSSQAAAESTADRYEAVSERCFSLLKKKQIKEAMEILQKSYRDAGSVEEKFKWRLLHAEVAVEAGKPEMAIALIDELEKDVEHYRLEEWQPDLVARVYTLLLNSFNRTQLEREKIDTAYQRLCRVDTAGAIDIKLH